MTTQTTKAPQILIVDLGSQYTQVIARTLRELGYRSAVLTGARAEQWLVLHQPKAVILSGGHASVTEDDAPHPPEAIWDLDIPILGICYGMQYMVARFGGSVAHTQDSAEYGPADVKINNDNLLFVGLEQNQAVWASHGDTAKSLPDGFSVIASTDNYPNVGICNSAQKLWGVQFHPEVTHTTNGKQMLANFAGNIAKCKKDWSPEDIIAQIRTQTKEDFGNQKTIIGFSGGVDSTTLTAILAPVLGDNLLTICIDAGQFRTGEIDYIRQTAKDIGVNLEVIEAEDELVAQIAGVTDAETKRSVFRGIYKQIFENQIAQFGAKIIAQGSLATDFIESGALGEGDIIKTHHNINLDFKVHEQHPLRDLFKYEVRALAHGVGLPAQIAQREPFPGPGLILRIVGASITPERLEIVRFGDDTVRSILRKNDLLNSDTLSQLVVYMLAGSPVVGVKGDGRVYDAPIVVRAIKTVDFMTGDGVQFPASVRTQITLALTKHPHISRVLFDETPKPPGTTEPE